MHNAFMSRLLKPQQVSLSFSSKCVLLRAFSSCIKPTNVVIPQITKLCPHTNDYLNELVYRAEPLIMSGDLSKYSKILKDYLSNNPNTESVSRILRAIIFARARRNFAQADETTEEQEAMSDLLNCIKNYDKYKNLFAAKQLAFMENANNIFGQDQKSDEETFALNLLPKFEDMNFNYVTEDRSPPLDLEIRDLTSCLEKKMPNRFVLMSANIFNTAYESERKSLLNQAICVDDFLELLNGAVVEDLDEDLEEDDGNLDIIDSIRTRNNNNK